jgi:hypothetical protein
MIQRHYAPDKIRFRQVAPVTLGFNGECQGFILILELHIGALDASDPGPLRSGKAGVPVHGNVDSITKRSCADYFLTFDAAK